MSQYKTGPPAVLVTVGPGAVNAIAVTESFIPLWVAMDVSRIPVRCASDDAETSPVASTTRTPCMPSGRRGA